jgi:hypothetical protein
MQDKRLSTPAIAAFSQTAAAHPAASYVELNTGKF